ncbi:hypothetical protein DP939_43310 [Spongiactinospora rosea]|uniref:Type VII secretion system protein EssD-like domain-containing protein n=2 Tax=Spongiactinospora rosea TaxID=2248750 RepID=A0A366LKI9_9ACTN|nr:hypothetical protein DP939_43310 [Spongiactinospora rosea]
MAQWGSAPAVGTFSIAGLSRPEARTLLRKILEDTAQLSDAVDAGVTAQIEEKSQVTCSATGCEVGSHIIGIVPSREASKRIKSRQVRVELTATVTIEGIHAGTCTTTKELALEGIGGISCSSPDAGRVFAEQEARKKQEAEAESRAQGGTVIPYNIHYAAATYVRVLAQVKMPELQEALRQEEQLAWEAPAPAEVAERAEPDRDDRTGDCNRFRPHRAVDNGEGWILNTTGAHARAQTGQACLKRPPSNSGGKISVYPVGYPQAEAKVRSLGRLPRQDLARCHIIAARFGGSNDLAANLSPCGQRITNHGALGMSAFEREMAEELALQPSGSILYLVEPFFRSDQSTIPKGFVMIAIRYTPTGVADYAIARSVLNVVEPISGDSLVNIGN